MRGPDGKAGPDMGRKGVRHIPRVQFPLPGRAITSRIERLTRPSVLHILGE